MNNFQKIKEIYESLGWVYYGWNDPDRKLAKGFGPYFVDKNAKRHSTKSYPTRNESDNLILMEPVHFSKNNSPDWDFIIRLINMVGFPIKMLGLSPYTKDKAIQEIYEFMQ